jgi:ABC-2 type transport system permease protein
MSNQIIALMTLTRKEIRRFLRIWTQTLLPSPISMVLYFLIFGSLIGQRIGKLDGFSYVEYIAPGLIMMAIINNSYANVVGSFFGAKFQRSLEELFVAPISSGSILTGYLLGGVLRGVLVGLLVTGIALFFTKIHLYSIWITCLVAVLTALLFSLAGLLNGIYAKTFDDIGIIPTFILSPLTYLGGVFYSINMLPPFWRSLSHFNPILYVVNAFRYGMLGVSDIRVDIALLYITAFVLILFVSVYYLLEKGISLKS